MRYNVLFLSLILSLPVITFSQTDTIRPVRAADFSPVSPLINANADAVILLDSGSTSLDANSLLGFYTVYHKFRRILILNKRALTDDQTSLSIGFYREINKGKKLKTLKACTYNLEKGQVVKTTVQDEDVFIENPKAEFVNLKFAFPNVRVGSIIEYDYTIVRYSRDLQDWYFQRSYPVLKSIYTARIPEFFNFHIVLQNKGYLTSTKRDSVTREIESAKYGYGPTKIQFVTWTMENIPAMREEPYTSTIDNYLACVKFQLSLSPISPGRSELVLTNWEAVSNKLLYSPEFGMPIEHPSPFIKRQTRNIVNESDPEIKKAKSIYEYVRNNYKVTVGEILISENLSLKEVFKTGTGNEAEINLLLIAMLRTQDIKADPVIMATRRNGRTDPNYPVLENYNYLICHMQTGGKSYYLDAADGTMGFGKISPELYNGHARAITKGNYPIFFSADSLRESTSTLVNVQYDTADKNFKLDWTQTLGYYQSADLRTLLKEESPAKYFKTLTDTISVKRSLDSFSILNLKNLDERMILNYSLSLKTGDEDHIYLNPMFNSGLDNNPFTAAERNYPVELPYKFDIVYVLNIEVPPGFEVEEMPPSVRLLLNNTDGSYEYRIQKDNTSVQLRSILTVNRATFDPEDYNTLRDFYAAIIKKQSEMIVFKKISKSKQ